MKRVPSSRGQSILAAAAATVLVTACDSATEFADPSRHIFHGSVSNTASAAIAGVTITATHHGESCAQETTFTEIVGTAANGTYRLDFRLFLLPHPVSCVKLKFEAQGYRPDSVDVPDLDFSSGSDVDSVRVDMILQPVQ